ncbi:Major Facilitator Superfamily protein [Enhydrobacter aerosaccus]|uniref:Major Facilitator Superfamily protein n=1 Tax=Enhydrobacter aerosaccus TaxID=225324 RepID=A0A1T4SL63_9HYPH|nr:MFS transporter [Enhydrobacter aerosaccus]SKA28937.1 Major Facilitator Superfamily protein [Enhydrobacter aerosaccus]
MNDIARKSAAGAALLALVGASLPMNLDPAIHNIAVVGAGNALHMTGTERSLVASLGTLCTAATILATGSLGDRFGRKKVMLLGLLVTLAGGVLAALAQNPLVFALGRAVSGVGFAASFGLSFALLRTIASDPEDLARIVAKWLALQTFAIVILCVAGGYLAGISWRAAYLVGPLVGMMALVWCLKVVPEAKDPDAGRFDGLGLVLVALGLVSALYAVSNAASSGWGSTKVMAPLLAGLVLLAAFGVWEWRSANPAFPIRSFTDPELMVGALSGIGFNVGNAVLAIQLSLLWQYVYRYKPIEVSLGQLPFIVACIAAASWAGRLVAKGVSMRLLAPAGLLAMAVALAAMAFAGSATPYGMFIVPLLAAGTGLMLTQAPTANVFVSKPPPALVGAVGSSRTAFGQFGFAFGLALSSSLLYGLFNPTLRQRLEEAGAPPGEQAQAIGILQSYVQTGNTDNFNPDIVHQVIASGTEAYLSSYRATMLIMAALVAVIAVLCLWILPRRTAKA